MATVVKLRGTKQPLSFGVQRIEGYIVDAQEETIEGEELEVEDEIGDVVAHFSGFGIRYKRTLKVIPLKNADELPLPGDELRVGDDFSLIVKSIKKARARKDVERWDVEGTWYPNVPMEVLEEIE